MPRRLVLPMALATLGLAILVSLGIWQLRRQVWKDDLILRLNARASAKPTAFDFDSIRDRDAIDWEFGLVEVKGRFRHETEFHVWTPQKAGSAWTVFTPFEVERSEARYPRLVLVARGIVPDALKPPEKRLDGQVLGPLSITARLRAGETPGLFSPEANLGRNEWHVRDIAGMRRMMAESMVAGSASGKADEAIRAISPGYLEQITDPPPGGWPRPQLAALNLKNDHFGYALTWFGLAATLIGVFAAFAYREWRREDGDPPGE